MFTGIVEEMAVVKRLEKENSNLHLYLECSFTPELKVDQSLAHNGVCLTVVEISGREYRVTAIEESLQRSNLGQLQEGDRVNVERCMPLNGRLDGHLVQGHVDTMATCEGSENREGSWQFHFRYPANAEHITVPKGSITINGVSLTVVDSSADGFSVSIIPYTYEHTNFRYLQAGDAVNLEFDIIGKYVARLMEQRR